MAAQTPEVKLEVSPAESFMSAPGEFYPSLFATEDNSIDLESAMTPISMGEAASTPAADSPAASTTESDKKPTKKRKSWGQVLPEPKTNLPPRKRAKTEDEKEQRRVERVLRNRRAAQSSRERKRQEVEALEEQNQVLQDQLVEQQKQNMRLLQELEKLRNGGVAQSSSTTEFLPSPITLSQPLFTNPQTPGMKDDLILMPETVNPATISPELNPVADDEIPSAPTETTSTDATQHPAVSIGRGSVVLGGLTDPVASSTVTLPSTSNIVDDGFDSHFGLFPAFDADPWCTENQFSPSADPVNFEYNHLVGNTTSELPDFDLSVYLEDLSGAPGAIADHDSIPQEPESIFNLDLENQVPSEAFDLQPHLGASTHGCDDGVLAVGV